MKCIDCGEEIQAEAKEKNFKITVGNPGILNAKGMVFHCTNSNCGQHYAEEESALKIIDALEKDRLRQEKLKQEQQLKQG